MSSFVARASSPGLIPERVQVHSLNMLIVRLPVPIPKRVQVRPGLDPNGFESTASRAPTEDILFPAPVLVGYCSTL